MSARRYVQRHLDVVALLKTLGASSRFALALSASQLLAIALLATVLGSIVGYLAQNGLLRALQGLITTDLPPPGSGPWFMGLVAAVLLLAGFALPPVVQLSKVPAIRILRRDMTAPNVVGAATGVVGDRRAAFGAVVLGVAGGGGDGVGWRRAAIGARRG